MATSQNPGPAGGPSNPTPDPTDVGRIEKEALAWRNILRLKGQINKASKAQADLQKELNKLQGQEAANARNMQRNATALAQLEKNLATARVNGNRNLVKSTERLIAMRKANEAQLAKTVGGSIRMQEMAAAKQKAALEAERNLIKDINKERGLGGKIADLFRSKEARQRSIDLARAKAGGGANTGELASGQGGGKGAALAAAGPYGAAAAAILATVDKLKAPFKAVGKAVSDGLTAPLSEAAALIDSGGYGIGGGKASGKGVTSMMDGVTNLITGFTDLIPVVGGFISMAVKGFNTLLQAILGINQAQVNFARNQGISLKQAQAIRAQFQGIAAASNNVVVNQTRLLEQQAELSEALGVTNIMSRSILENDVKLKDIAGFELESREKIAQLSIITGKNAGGLTKELMGQVGYVKKMTGISFNFRNVMGDLAKLSGVLGLEFAKFPGKIASTMMKVKVLGFDLKELRDTAGGFLDFESSISKEFEAQVISGKEMNLTKARDAAMNNRYAELSAEIAKNVGKASDYLEMDRFKQEAIAAAVNMTADSLADVLTKQEMYNKLGATNQKDALANFNILNKTVEGKEKLKVMLGEEMYAGYTQISIAEKLSAVMDKIKQTFIDFIEKSKIFEFLTDEKRVNNFIRSILNNLAGAIDVVGQIISGTLAMIGDFTGIFSDKYGNMFKGLSETVSSGTGMFTGGIRAASGGIGLADGGIVTETGMAKVDKGEVYLGANSISVIKDQLDAQKKTNELLAAMINQKQSVQIDGREVAVAYNRNASTIYHT